MTQERHADTAHATAITQLVGGRGVAPDPSVDAAEDEAEIPGAEHDRQCGEERRALDVVARTRRR